MSEQYLKEVTIGKPQEINGPIHLSSYQKEWPKQYENIRLQIIEALPHEHIEIEHVGSTSVPGLSAKPIIDVILFVDDPSDEKRYVPALEQVGFVLRIREENWYEHRMFKGHDPEVNLHVFPFGCVEALRMIRFRDLLRTYPNERLYYEKTKQKLAEASWHYVQDYADAKSAVIREILARHENG